MMRNCLCTYDSLGLPAVLLKATVQMASPVLILLLLYVLALLGLRRQDFHGVLAVDIAGAAPDCCRRHDVPWIQVSNYEKGRKIK